MNSKDFTTTIVVDESPQTVFNALTHPENWWSGIVEGSATNLDDEFTYRYKELHLSRQRVVEFIPEKKIVWLVVESKINYVENINEWTGTKISFEISKEKNNTRLIFTHIGLHPEIECFNSCSTSWNNLIRLSLLKLIVTGKGESLVLA